MIKTEIRIWFAHGTTFSELLSYLGHEFDNVYSTWKVLLEVYFNWPHESLKSNKKCASYGIFMPTSRFTDIIEE